jgi:hypothetical protein
LTISADLKNRIGGRVAHEFLEEAAWRKRTRQSGGLGA